MTKTYLTKLSNERVELMSDPKFATFMVPLDRAHDKPIIIERNDKTFSQPSTQMKKKMNVSSLATTPMPFSKS